MKPFHNTTPQEEVIEVFKEKSKQPKGNNVQSHTADVVMFYSRSFYLPPTSRVVVVIVNTYEYS
jgi:hypothetical protein